MADTAFAMIDSTDPGDAAAQRDLAAHLKSLPESLAGELEAVLPRLQFPKHTLAGMLLL